MALVKKLTKISNSYGIILPTQLLKDAGIKNTGLVNLKLYPGGIQIEPVESRETRGIAAAAKYLKKYRSDFKKMAR